MEPLGTGRNREETGRNRDGTVIWIYPEKRHRYSKFSGLKTVLSAYMSDRGCSAFYLAGFLMPPKATKAPPAPAPKPNMDLVQSILAKARATANKRKVDGVESASPATKAKATPVPPPAVVAPKVCPAVPPAGGSAKAQPPPPPAKAIPPQAPAPSDSTEASSPVPKTAAPAPPPPSAKIQQALNTAKEIRLHKAHVQPKAHAPDPNTPPPKVTSPPTLQKAHTPESLHTPPPKHAFASPMASPAETVRSNSWESNSWEPSQDDWWMTCNSQREYYGRQGLSWWREYDGLSPYAPGNWMWDSWNNRYVFTEGSQSWVSKSWDTNGDGMNDETYDDGNLSTPSMPATPVGPPGSGTSSTENDALDANGADAESGHVREALACRKPSAPNVTSPEPANDSAVPPETEAAPETAAAEPVVPPLPSSGMAVKAELPDSEASGMASPVDAWRCDKHGKPCTPEALYMRFYRRLRSYSFQLFHFLVVVIV